MQELSVSVFEICAELRVPFLKNIAKLLEGRLSINKMNVKLEMKVWNMFDIEILAKDTHNLFVDFVVL